MGWLNGKRNGHKHSHIDPATGRNRRDKSPLRAREQGRGGGVPRRNGKAVGRAEWRRARKTRGR